MTPVLRVIRNLCGLSTMFETLRPDANLRRNFLSDPRSRASVHRISSLTGTCVGRYGPSCIFFPHCHFISFHFISCPPSLFFSALLAPPNYCQPADRAQDSAHPWRTYVHFRHTHDSKRPVVRLCHTHPVSMCNPSTWPAKTGSSSTAYSYLPRHVLGDKFGYQHVLVHRLAWFTWLIRSEPCHSALLRLTTCPPALAKSISIHNFDPAT